MTHPPEMGGESAAGSNGTRLELEVPATRDRVSALLLRPPAASCLLLLAHGAGAGMEHRFMTAIAEHLAALRVATLRYQFPYMEAGRRRPDRAPMLEATVRAAAEAATTAAPDLPLLAGGKSMGGRMTSRAAAAAAVPDIRALVFLGFPLHPAGRPGTERADHLQRLDLPMLFIQGTRDRLAELDLLLPVLGKLRSRVHLHVIADADHSFQVLKRTGRSNEDVLEEVARTVAGWSRAETA